MINYTVEIQTGVHTGAGTDANVYIQLIGALGMSPEIELDNSQDNFEKGKFERFPIMTDDVGWIDSIRMFHNDKRGDSGWYLDYVNVINEENGLSFKADFYRWLARDEDDGEINVTKSIPVNTVTVSRGQITSYFMGYNVLRKSNSAQVDLVCKENFTFQYRQGMSLKKTKSSTINGGFKLSPEFFGEGCEFTLSVSRTIIDELSTTEEQTVTATSEIQFTLHPTQNLTAVTLYYQNILSGEARANGVVMEFEDKYLITQSVLFFDGLLSDADIQKKVTEYIKATQDPNMIPIPAHIPRREACIPLHLSEVPEPLTFKQVRRIIEATRKHWIDKINDPRVQIIKTKMPLNTKTELRPRLLHR